MGKITRVALLFCYLSSLHAAQDSLYKKAESYFFQKKYEVAETLLKQVLAKNPVHGQALSLMGDVYLVRRNYKAALKYYRQAVEVSENPAVEYFRIGQAYQKLQQAEKAIKSYEKCYALDSSIKEALFQIGYVWLYDLRDKKNTIYYWQKFIDEKPDDEQYDKIKRVIALLKDPNFKLPPKGSEISIEEALLLGGSTIAADKVKKKDSTAGHEKMKTNNKTEGLIDDTDL